ncbi:MAG: SiaC family regulatory phosphoprotein [Crocinitomicaceae bacterium]|nr:SiaC family regulatory phosphoprotein [Crocinitomicaceae bacterium]
MENLLLEATTQTPKVDFNASTGIMQINGRCIPDTPDDFWLPVMNWFESYMLKPIAETVFKIDLEYFATLALG